MRKHLDAPAIRWALVSLLLAPLALYIYCLFEWLFLSTSISHIAELDFGTRVEALLRAPLPFLPPLIAVQAVLSIVSAFHPKLRSLAILPAAVILGLLAFILIDNFTYTVFRFGVLRTGSVTRTAYAILLPLLMGAIGWKLHERLASVRRWPASLALAGAVATLLISAIPARSAADPLSGPTRERNGLEWATATPLSQAEGAGSSSRTGESPPNILFLASDGLDASNLSVYGYSRETTPYLQKLAAESLFFENPFSNVGRTHGSLVALLTGRLPTRTKVIFPPTILKGEDSYRHLPGLLRTHGYTTLQLGMRHYADAEDANMLGAFDAANYRWEDLLTHWVAIGEGEAKTFRMAMVERAEERILHAFGVREMVDSFGHVAGERINPYWSDERRVATLIDAFRELPEPWFIHVHLLDSHCCGQVPNNDHFHEGRDGEEKERDVRDNAIREADGHIETLLETLRREGQLERTIVVISSDHTEVWGTSDRVPLLIRFPAAGLTGSVPTNVQLVDVAPTILDYLGLEIPQWMDGLSLLRWREIDPARPVFSIEEISRARKSVAPRFSAVIDGGAPNYGAGSAMVIVGDQWQKITLDDGTIRSGVVRDHTRPGAARLDQGEALNLLREHLGAEGFRINRPAEE